MEADGIDVVKRDAGDKGTIPFPLTKTGKAILLLSNILAQGTVCVNPKEKLR